MIVTYVSGEGAKKAIEEFPKSALVEEYKKKNVNLILNYFLSKDTKIFVSGLKENPTSVIKKAFEHFGEIAEITVNKTKFGSLTAVIGYANKYFLFYLGIIINSLLQLIKRFLKLKIFLLENARQQSSCQAKTKNLIMTCWREMTMKSDLNSQYLWAFLLWEWLLSVSAQCHQIPSQCKTQCQGQCQCQFQGQSPLKLEWFPMAQFKASSAKAIMETRDTKDKDSSEVAIDLIFNLGITDIYY